MIRKYTYKEVEFKIQKYWEKTKSFLTSINLEKKKYYCLSMFPYPSGNLHMGHVRNYTIGDVISRYKRMSGLNVLNPMGWDAFGLPAENAAIKKNTHPAIWTYKNIINMKQQLSRLGFSYDWDKEITTCDKKYYKWSQWLFICLLKKQIIYKHKSIVNWDPVDKTVLANEQIVNGKGWRSGAQIQQRRITQWFLKTSNYVEELFNELNNLVHWPTKVINMQKNWIGRKNGWVMIFPVLNQSYNIKVFIQNPFKILCIKYIYIYNNHFLINLEDNKKIKKYNFFFSKQTIIRNFSQNINNVGVKTSLQVINPLNKNIIFVWITANNVSNNNNYAFCEFSINVKHNWFFLQKYKLSQIKNSIIYDKSVQNKNLYNVKNSTLYTLLEKLLIKNSCGYSFIQYSLKNWSISRQRYWGVPIPIIYCKNCGTIPVQKKDLPVLLPENTTFDKQRPFIINSQKINIHTICYKCHKSAIRETDTFDTFFESSWYYNKYASSDDTMICNNTNYWVPVDQYIGGAEHAVMHLLYSRLMHKILRDLNLIKSGEPFKNLLTHGMVLQNGIKMSKSIGNIINPNNLVKKYGADTVRLFIISAAPSSKSLEWSKGGIKGIFRFINKLWISVFEFKNKTTLPKIVKINKSLTQYQWLILEQLNITLIKIKQNIKENMHNTSAALIMKLLNTYHDLVEKKLLDIKTSKKVIVFILKILSPMTPHVCQFLWNHIGKKTNILNENMPKIIANISNRNIIKITIQVDGKKRTNIVLYKKPLHKKLLNKILNHNIKYYYIIKYIKKVIFLPWKILNIILL